MFVSIVFIVPFTAYGLITIFENRFKSFPVYERAANKNGKVEQQISAINLLRQDGRQSNTGDWAGKIVIANLFYSHCPVICPKMMSQLNRVQEEFKSNNKILLRSFSVDPERDSVRRLGKYAAIFHINMSQWHLLTGDKKVIYRFARNDLMIVATDGEGGADDFIHSDRLVLIDPKGQVRGYYKGTLDADVNKLIKDIKKLEHEK